jgi:hypothetical protein
MSLLDTPAAPSAAQSRANRALQMPRIILAENLRSWARSLDLVWNPPAPATPAQVLAQLGTNGAELFQRSAALAAFLESQKPGCTAIPQAARIKPVTINADGSVTLKPAT